MKKILDPFTFGGNQAAVNLTDMLNSIEIDSRAQRYVGSFLAESNAVVNALSTLEDKRIRMHLLHLQREHVHHSLKNSNTIPERVKSHVANVAIGKIKKLMRDTYEESIEEKALNHRFRAWMRTNELEEFESSDIVKETFRKINDSDQFTIDVALEEFKHVR